MRARNHSEIGSHADDWLEVRRRSAPALAVANGEMVGPRALLLTAVEVARDRIARLLGGTDEGAVNWVARRPARNPKRPALPVPGVGAVLVMLSAFEVGEHVSIAPAGQAKLAPVVVVAGVAAYVDHAVNGGRSAPAAPARLVKSAPVQEFLRRRLEPPVRRPLVGDHVADAGGHLNQYAFVFAARLDQGDLDIGILGQPVGQDAASAASADNDIVESLSDLGHAALPVLATLRRAAPVLQALPYRQILRQSLQ